MAALVGNAGIARQLVELFETRFDPSRFGGQAGPDRAAAEAAIVDAVHTALDAVQSLDQDRIIRALLGVVTAGLRTSYYQSDPTGGPRPYVSLKLDPKRVPDLPAPRPMFEIWVYGPRVEGVHLRFGKVARGGLRWSDRREDFRTEILGLVKAQMVKNAVIVPTGSKGGFYAKQLPDPTVDRDAWLAEGIASYRLFISGLLDLTDNLVAGEAVPPADVVRHDGDDTYLVVAADKGTATFSDIANARAQDYGFWLDDAFASGGSAGYDHKVMGITARGAWESVKRHFREMGVDTQTQDFTVVGVGDMSGDVFGNGMLLSEHIRLVAAFDHRHVFVDPTPDAATSYAERRRLFDLPRSSWADYDASLISTGGGVFDRAAKSVPGVPGDGDGARAAQGHDVDHPGRADEGDPSRAGRPAVERRDRHLRQGVDGEQRRDRRPGQRRDPGRRERVARQGGRRGRQPRVLPARAHRGRAGRRPDQHRRDRQLRGGRHQRPRGQHQDPAHQPHPGGRDDAGGAQHPPAVDDRRGRPPGAARQLRAERPARQRPRPAAAHAAGAPAAHPLAGGARRPRPRAGVPPVRRRDRQAPRRPPRADLTGVLGAGGLRQARPQGGPAPHRAARRPVVPADAHRLLPGPDQGAVCRAARLPPAAPRDRHQRGRQLARQPRRHHLRVPGRGGDRRDRRGGRPRVRRLPRGVRAVRLRRRASRRWTTSCPPQTQTALYLEFRRLLDRAARWFLTARPTGIDIVAEVDRFRGPVAQFAPRIPQLLQGGERKRLERRGKELEKLGAPHEMALRAATLLDLYSLLDVVDLAHDAAVPGRGGGRRLLLRLGEVRHRRDAHPRHPAAARRPVGRARPRSHARRPLRRARVAHPLGAPRRGGRHAGPAVRALGGGQPRGAHPGAHGRCRASSGSTRRASRRCRWPCARCAGCCAAVRRHPDADRSRDRAPEHPDRVDACPRSPSSSTSTPS